ncbi:MAG TPA: hypothetical protein VMU58_03425 [Gaiellaceae bacterium]|nr:hypothetical protein [Gaiellaceae bacterium]
MTRVLFVCPQNADRSQVAQAFYERRGGDARSAGTAPAAELLPVVVDALAELGFDVSGRTPRALSGAELEWADLVVTMGCADACPVIPGTAYLEWQVADPAGLCLEEARELCSAIEQRVAALPL